MALTNREEVRSFITATHDPDHLRVLKQIIDQRLMDMGHAASDTGNHLTQPHVAAGEQVKEQRERLKEQAAAQAGPAQPGQPQAMTAANQTGRYGE